MENEYRVGETFTFGKKTLICVEASDKEKSCKDCFLFGICDALKINNLLLNKFVGECCAPFRSDNTDVIFKEAENNNK